MIALTQMIVVAILFVTIANIMACMKNSFPDQNDDESSPK